jgi:ankyrin repeat protein
MVLLNSADPAEYKADLPRPVQGTCRWILNHPQYISWITQEQSALLWITGEPGCGKTILSAYLTDHLTLSRTQLQPDVFFFFCNDQITTQNDAKAIIRSILHQILRKHRSLIKHLKSRYETDGSSIIHSFPALWETFLKVVRDSKSGPIGVIIDAIDECEESTRRIFLNHVKQLVYESGGLNNSGQQTYIKFLITSQPYLGNLFNSSEFILSHLPIEKDGRRISEDVRLVIKSKVGEIAKTFQLSNETKAYLEEVLDSKADRTFLWVELILRSLEETSDASKKEFERIINTFPDDLQETYKRFLRRIPLKNLERAKTVLHILIGSARHLNLAEINIAFTIDQSHKTVAEVRSDYQPSMGQTLQRNAGAFIRVNNSKVSLIHQSAKEFLTNLALHSEDPLVNSYGINSANAALGITRRCVRYLLLDDFMIDLFALRRTNSETSSPSSFIFDDEDVKLLNSQFDGLGLENDHIFKDEHAWDEETYSLIAEKYEFFDYAATHWGEHFSQCEIIASVQVRDSVLRLIDGGNCALKNWLKYYWIKTSMEYPFPESFENVMVASFFNLSMLLDQLLQSKEYDESAKNQALFWAGRMNCPNSVKVLLQHGGNPNCQVFEHTPLTVAAKHGNLNVVRLLLAETRTDHAFRAKHGRSALSLAAGNGHWEVVNTILNQGRCPANDQDRAGSTPLFWAVGGDYDRVVRRLLETFVVNLNHLDKFGRSATSWAAGDGSLKALRILVKHKKVNVNLSDSTGRSPLSWAAGNGQTEAVGILMRSKKLEKSSTDMDGRSAISWACQGAHVNTLKTLLKYECPGVDDEDVSGWTPLAWALNHNSPATVETLISARTVEIDRQDKSGRTALSWSASYGYLEVVQLLISHGAKVKIVDHGGRKAAHWATINGHTEVAEMLETKAERD